MSVRRLISFQRPLYLILSGQRFSRNSRKKDELHKCIFQRRAHRKSWKSYVIIYLLPDFTEHLQERNGVVSLHLTSPRPFPTHFHAQTPGPRRLVFSWLRGFNSYTSGKEHEINENSVELCKPNFLGSAGSSRGLRGKELFSQALLRLTGHKPAAADLMA